MSTDKETFQDWLIRYIAAKTGGKGWFICDACEKKLQKANMKVVMMTGAHQILLTCGTCARKVQDACNGYVIASKR